MKRLLLVTATLAILAGCSSAPSDPYARRVYEEQERKEEAVKKVTAKRPDWMTKVPKSNTAIYASGTAASTDYESAVRTATLHAYGKICMSAGGTVDQRSSVYQSDSGDVTVGVSESTIRAVCKAQPIMGVEVSDMEVVPDARKDRFRAYVLIALPYGDANQIRKDKIQEDLARDAVKRSREVIEDMDKNPAQPANKVEGINLLPVDNAEYKAKRETALKKPGAVIGQTTVE